MNCNINKSNKEILDIFDKLDIKLDNNIDYIQEQLNIIKKSYLDIYKKTQVDNKRYELLFNEVQTINDVINNNILNVVNCPPNQCYSSHIMFCDTSQIHIFPIDSNVIKVIYITAVGGGGAGGRGLINNMFYYSGSGGGSGAGLIKRPIIITNNIILKITIGKGGILGNYNSSVHGTHTQQCGSNTIIEIISNNCDEDNEIIILNGGQNGVPTDCVPTTHDIKGGAGGHSDYCMLDGHDGCDGSITIPSQPISCGGNGGCSILSPGGHGGTKCHTIGKDGKYGSGGGGSCPSINVGDKLAGNGGDGIVIVEW